MAVTVKEDVQAVGTWDVDLDFTPAVKALLVDEDNYGRPRKLYAMVYDALVGGSLVYPPLVLTRATPTPEGIRIGGVGILWALGSGDIGPMITDREYVSGEDKLDNGGFELDDLYWVRSGEDSRWVLASGTATNVGGLGKDDPLEVDRKFPTRPGYAYRATASGVSGTGKLRIRTIYEGLFNPANLLANWLTPDALTIGPIAKPQLLNFGAGPVTLGPTMTFAGGVLTAGWNPPPQYIDDPNLLLGAGDWTGVGPNIGDVEIVNEPTEGFGGWTIRAGPVTQHQVFQNSDFEDGLNFWYASSEDADPDPGLFYPDVGGGLDGSDAATTAGSAPSGRILKYLRADASGTVGVTAYDVKPGEQYTYEVYVRAAPGTDGSAYISLHIPHPTVANRERWYTSNPLEGTKVSDDVFRRQYIDLSIPANRFKVDALCEVHDHTTGYWAFDNATMTRTRGNRAQLNYNTAIPVVADTRYLFAIDMRSSDDLQVGSVRVGVILKGTGLPDIIVDSEKGNTDYVWTREIVTVTPPTGYTTATPFVAALDIVGAPIWLDFATFVKDEKNQDTSNWASVPVVADQRYLLQANVEVDDATTRGSVVVGVVLSGPAVENEYVTMTLDSKETGIHALKAEVKPAPGYDAATLYVQSTDVSGEDGAFHIYSATLTKMDNNTAETVGTAITVTPERTYKWSQEVLSGANLQRGTVKLSVTCIRAGYDDIVFDSPAMDATEGARKVLTFDFTPPSGYDEIVPRVIGTDVEGDNWLVGAGQIRDNDTGTVVFDAVTVNPAGTDFFVDSTAPDGAESVRVAVIVEQGTTNWSVDAVSFKRTGVTPATGNAIIADLLTDPETGLPLSIAAGTINAPAVIPHDWLIQNMTNRAALDHLCNVVYPGGLEYRINPTLPPTIDVGPPGTVFDTHDPADALLPEDLDVEDLSDPEVDVEERPTVIRLFGAERRRLDGSTYLVTADATVPGAVEYDLNNRAIRRVLPVHDGTVDHQAYADAYAADLALRAASPPLALTAKLSGKDTRAEMPPGDTTHVFEPESGLEDDDNPTTIEGKPATPRAVTVLSRERAHGPSYRVEMLTSTGTTFELPGVLWSDEDATVLTIGDRLPDWSADPQGMAPGIAYLRDRASRPR